MASTTRNTCHFTMKIGKKIIHRNLHEKIIPTKKTKLFDSS